MGVMILIVMTQNLIAIMNIRTIVMLNFYTVKYYIGGSIVLKWMIQRIQRTRKLSQGLEKKALSFGNFFVASKTNHSLRKHIFNIRCIVCFLDCFNDGALLVIDLSY